MLHSSKEITETKTSKFSAETHSWERLESALSEKASFPVQKSFPN